MRILCIFSLLNFSISHEEFLAILNHKSSIRLYLTTTLTIRSSEKFLSLYKEIMNAQHFPFYIILSNDPLCSIKIKITTFDRLGFMRE